MKDLLSFQILSCVCEILTVASKHEGNGVPEYSFVTPRFSVSIFLYMLDD